MLFAIKYDIITFYNYENKKVFLLQALYINFRII